jgi:hypothetical protein
VPLEPGEREGEITLEIDYRAVFDDPAPRLPANTDNPGYGVHATIRPEGTLLLGGSGWYPAVAGADESYRLTVSAPPGVYAVTSGEPLDRRRENGRSVSVWGVSSPVEALALAAGPYRIDSVERDGVTLATYFHEETADLSPAYLEASARYLSLYASRFGPYPFRQFAVVENFFPTGYGFPSFTLIGGRVLRLPFILQTSLGHEIAHCWWGNGVLVDFGQGNWSEGLVSYVAEHLYQEMDSEAAARDHRRQYLRNYAALVDPGDDFPLSRFRSRTDGVSRTVGYDKAAMVFHMLRTRLGDAVFDETLKEVYRDRLFTAVSWSDFREAFERRSGEDLGWFFAQWIDRPGAIRLRLEDVDRSPAGGGWRAVGSLRQEPPFYRATVTVEVLAPSGSVRRSLPIDGRHTRFEIRTEERPERIEVDPDVDLFRRLHPEEIPPSVNGLKGAPEVLVVLCGDGAALERAAAMLVRAMPLSGARIVKEDALAPDAIPRHHLVVVGRPRSDALGALVAGRIPEDGEPPVLEGMPASAEGDAAFAVYDHPRAPGRLLAVFVPGAPAHAEAVARKIPHYGRYSYLAFRSATNTAKGVWPVLRSPLIHGWEPETAPAATQRSAP